MAYFLRKGSILIAMLLAIVLSVTTVSFFVMLTGRATFTANQLKRAQAINCAEAAIYEAFNRIRAGQFTPANWGTQIINVPVCNDVTAGTTYNVQVSVTISASAPHAVDATVDYTNIRM